jgi:hypothetical protein
MHIQRVDKIIETLRNWEFVLTALKEVQLAAVNEKGDAQ